MAATEAEAEVDALLMEQLELVEKMLELRRTVNGLLREYEEARLRRRPGHAGKGDEELARLQVQGGKTKPGERVVQGFFDLAQAKNAMGPTAISPLKYDTRMTALATTTLSSPESQSPVVWALSRSGVGDASPSASGTTEPSTARAAKSAAAAAAAAAIQAEPGSGAPMGADTDAPPPTPVDPLRWFGVLVSPHLRKAQERFVQALPSLVALANYQAKLEDLRTRYHDKLRALAP